MPLKRSATALAYLSSGLIIFGIKLWLIRTFGNATPYWDQWDHEAHLLYGPFIDHTLTWQTMFSALNEHRIFFTRALNLLELVMNGIWNPLLQMTVNAFMHVLVILFLVSLLSKSISTRFSKLVLVFATALYCLPFAWENTLAGIQSMFYFALFFSLSAIWLLLAKPLFSRAWWLGIICSGCAYFSLASGVFALVAIAGVYVFQCFFSTFRTNDRLKAIFTVAALTGLAVAFTPSLSYHEPLKAHSISQFTSALLGTLAWPEASGVVAAVIRNLPSLFFLAYFFRHPPQKNDRRWFLFGAILWMLITCAALAAGRATGSTASRYLDLLAIYVVINFICLIYIVEQSTARKTVWLSATWIIALTISMGIDTERIMSEALPLKRIQGLKQEANTRAYLLNFDETSLRGKPFLEIPYPDPDRLMLILNSESVRSILPQNIRAENNVVSYGKYDQFVEATYNNYGTFIGLGILLALLGIATSWFDYKFRYRTN